MHGYGGGHGYGKCMHWGTQNCKITVFMNNSRAPLSWAQALSIEGIACMG